MKTRSIPLAAAAFAHLHEYQRIGWFMYRLFEREHRLNLDALARHCTLRRCRGWTRCRVRVT